MSGYPLPPAGTYGSTIFRALILLNVWYNSRTWTHAPSDRLLGNNNMHSEKVHKSFSPPRQPRWDQQGNIVNNYLLVYACLPTPLFVGPTL